MFKIIHLHSKYLHSQPTIGSSANNHPPPPSITSQQQQHQWVQPNCGTSCSTYFSYTISWFAKSFPYLHKSPTPTTRRPSTAHRVVVPLVLIRPSTHKPLHKPTNMPLTIHSWNWVLIVTKRVFMLLLSSSLAASAASGVTAAYTAMPWCPATNPIPMPESEKGEIEMKLRSESRQFSAVPSFPVSLSSRPFLTLCLSVFLPVALSMSDHVDSHSRQSVPIEWYIYLVL